MDQQNTNDGLYMKLMSCQYYVVQIHMFMDQRPLDMSLKKNMLVLIFTNKKRGK